MIVGAGAADRELTRADVRTLLAHAFDGEHVEGKRVLAVIPDGTRSAPIPLLFQVLYEILGPRARQLDYLIALGTHPPMSPDAIDRLVGVPAEVRAERYPSVRIFNHQWDRPEVLTTVGTISRAETDVLTGGLL